MKKNHLQTLLFVVLLAMSISAQIFMDARANTPTANISAKEIYTCDSLPTPASLDVEILKVILEQGKKHLPIISTSTGSID